jgi:hypothetical protein
MIYRSRVGVMTASHSHETGEEWKGGEAGICWEMIGKVRQEVGYRMEVSRCLRCAYPLKMGKGTENDGC